MILYVKHKLSVTYHITNSKTISLYLKHEMDYYPLHQIWMSKHSEHLIQNSIHRC